MKVLLRLSESTDGTASYITGTAGVILSPNYPGFYPSDFEHTWTINAAVNATIELTVKTMKTEANVDYLTVSSGFFFNCHGTSHILLYQPCLWHCVCL